METTDWKLSSSFNKTRHQQSLFAGTKIENRKMSISIVTWWSLEIDEELKGKIGHGDSEVIRNPVIAHLHEKGYCWIQKQACTSQTNC